MSKKQPKKTPRPVHQRTEAHTHTMCGIKIWRSWEGRLRAVVLSVGGDEAAKLVTCVTCQQNIAIGIYPLPLHTRQARRIAAAG